ncbi:response regulator [Candidatus Thiodictyon syntrophicum]|jgi:diguanylate cyclase (GGDEF)-like protein/PAS domain S-box-containing protein|uniref:Sensory/regulatory protein RpfC n=1 Tax=Candidatus Thiodictyon syntrophicum TaxID=1166950 RepID=A0A2K8U5P8_9GAMM|nr:response regulator [Candidatus Thiodictyon syntrophicum]AUB80918.1 hypothetical protein THSYN_08110 [Candidatus Thiodictyon syntrophicum]
MTDTDDRPAPAIPPTDLRREAEPGPEPTLRQRAEQTAGDTAAQPPEALAALSPQDLQRTAVVQASEGMLRTIYDLLPVGISITDRSGRIIDCNQTAARLLDLTRAEHPQRHYVGKDWAIIRADGTPLPADAHACVRAMVEQRPVREVEMGLVKPAGITWLSVSATSTAHADYGVVITYVDMTERRQGEAALRTGKQQLDMALQAAAMGIWDWEIATGRVAWAGEHAALFGNPPADFGGTIADVQACVHPDDRAQGMAVFQRTIEEGSAFDNTYRVVWPDGSLHWLHSLGQVTRDERGVPQRILGTTQDITASKRAEEALRRSQAMLARTEAIAHVGSWEWDVTTDTVTWSAELFRIMQRDPAAGAPSFADQSQRYVPEDRQRFREAVDVALTAGAPFELELRAMRTDGATVVTLVVGNVEIGTGKRVTRLFGCVQDVTERHAADRALRASEQRFRTMIDVAPVPFFLIDAQQRFTYQNRACIELFGYTLADMPTLAEWWPLAYPDPDYRQWVMDIWRERTGQARQDGGPFAAVPEVTIRCKNGQDRTVLAGTAVLGCAFEEPFLVSFSDVTDLKEAREAAEQAARVKSEFLANMSHEIRTPLNAMLGLAQLLEGEALAAEQRHLVQQLRTAGRSLLRLVNDILDLSKLESGRLRLEVRTYAPAAVLAQVQSLLGQQARAKGLDFRLEIPAGLSSWLRGDPLRLEQILVNLVGNAVKFTERGGVLIRVSQQEVDTRTVRLRLEVRDTGIGISPEHLTILGTPFTQADGSITRRFGGTGLGLAISKQLVERMGGRFGVDSTLGVGSSFWFELPCERASANDTPPQQAAPAERPAGPCLSGVHCLVVDDSPLNRAVVERALRREGARTTLVADGQQALDCLRAHAQDIDAVLMDIQMPVMDGLTATRAIRQALGLTALPVIAFSANVLAEQRHQAQEAGVSDFLAKPVDLDDLVAVLRRWTNPPPAVAPGAAGPVPIPAPTPSPGPAGFPDIPGIDGRRAARLLDQDWAFFLRLAHRFAADFADATRQIHQALARGEASAAARRLHTLRGHAGNLGALALAQSAQALETALAAPRVDPAPALADFDARLCALLTALAPWLEGAAPLPDAAPAAPLDEGRLTALCDALSGHDLETLDLFEVEVIPENPAIRILIIDDDPVSVQIMARALKPVCRCDFALSGPQALERLAAERLPTLILLDVMMPEMDGYTLCRMLQADPRLKGIPVIFVTASHDSDSETQALEAGAADFIAKPINPPVLRLRVGLQCQLREREQALRDSEARFEHLAHFDALTGLPNRLLLADRLHLAMAQARRRGQGLAVVYLDLDGFKAINDAHGHAVGDQLLVTVAHHLKQTLRESDTLARIGGDEFVAVLIDLNGSDASVPPLNRLLAAASAPLALGDLVVQVSASLGVTFYPQPQEIDADQLLRQADQAMYQAKLTGKNRYHVFNLEEDHCT